MAGATVGKVAAHEENLPDRQGNRRARNIFVEEAGDGPSEVARGRVGGVSQAAERDVGVKRVIFDGEVEATKSTGKVAMQRVEAVGGAVQAEPQDARAPAIGENPKGSGAEIERSVAINDAGKREAEKLGALG